MAATKTLTIALLGNPNTGKSTLFNALTGLRQHVGNWPGKTVEKAEGFARLRDGQTVRIVDLPGTYALHAESPEERIACEFLLSDEVDAVIVVVDATNLARNLYLVLQALELTDKIVVALNLMDEAAAKGVNIHLQRLRDMLGVPVVPTVAVRGEGVAEALEAAVAVAEGRLPVRPVKTRYPLLVENCLQKVTPLLEQVVDGRWRTASRWLALRLLEGDELALAWLSQRDGVVEQVLNECRRDAEGFGTSLDLEIARTLHERATAIASAVTEQTPRPSLQLRFGRWVVVVPRFDWTEWLDNLLTHRWLGLPLTLALFGLIFWLTAIGANKPSAWLEGGVSWLVAQARHWANAVGLSWWLKGVLVDGVLLGVGSVFAVMFPPMLIFYLLYAVLEDFGLVPRIAFNLDKVMQKVGSQGKHCLSCMVSYGCNIPGVLATRVIEDPRVRLIAILTAALNPCNGRWGNLLPLSLLLFGKWAPLVLVALIAISFTAVLFGSWLLSHTVLKGTTTLFVLELPPYRKPSLRKLLVNTVWERAVQTQYRALLIAAPFCALIWLLSNLPVGAPFERTVTGNLVATLDVAGKPLGLDGSMLTACLFALPAKEIALASLAITYGLQRTLDEPAAVLDFLRAHWSPLAAFTFLVFYALYLPCAYTFVVQAKEAGHWKWAVFAGAFQLSVAVLFTAAVHWSGVALIAAFK
ncbi:Fe(2+) transporter FeoB [bacterium HR17]|uniref:Ferrous iron transport protein B n=1 Tax=Candidatus Fervidibacter japonicus TaxID=2035412 RepID=A0A2H5XBI5_9BACT|nr:Fe(2+) transporter FeoB [bacterium HR17]